MEFTAEELKTWLETTKHVGSTTQYISGGEWCGFEIREKDGVLYAVGYYEYGDPRLRGYTELWENDRTKRGYHRVRRVELRSRLLLEEYYVDSETGEDLNP